MSNMLTAKSQERTAPDPCQNLAHSQFAIPFGQLETKREGRNDCHCVVWAVVWIVDREY